jgi:CDP-glucose 4,6-dehydratase
VPDLVRAASSKTLLFLRYPQATRPWQHVLEPLSGYLTLGWRLLEGKTEMAGAWNFGPDNQHNVTVLELVKQAVSIWPVVQYDFEKAPQPHEAGYLMLDSTKANKLLKWKTVWDFETTVRQTIAWYREFYEHSMILTSTDLTKFVEDATKKSLVWTKL